MDPFSTAAAAIPLAVLFLQSIKLSCGVLSTYKDTKEQVNRLLKHIESLLSTLERLSRSRAISDERDETLAMKIKACAKDIEAYDKMLKAMAVGGAEKMVKRQWKTLKASFKIKDLEKMSTALAEHRGALSLHLNAIESDMLFEVRDQLAIVEREGRTIQKAIGESRAAVIEHHTSMAATVRETVTTTLHDTMAQVTDETRSNGQAFRAALLGLGSKVQGDQMIDMLNQILEQLSRLSVERDVGARVEELRDEQGNQQSDDVQGNDDAQKDMQSIDDMPAEDVLPYAMLKDSITSILTALHNKQGVFSLDEAADIGDALVALLQTMASDAFLASAATSVSTYQHWCETGTKRDLAQLRKNLKTVQGIALSSQKVSVNEKGQERSPVFI
ncbi:hypothetical protein SPBR_05949 [Sporothrix brasiliensis 5110]|uniref:Azaphilone pigments biosynthesis cluster protein L N-terminal domain-containing protein n=1 Tax=Sporothrix brasiliensis 5110 TaxID=1398154 RepID=A0A0C2J4T1_9PEZI|nr:uncharacterized protein SPBR_05949 [Sporothrix brasiliensis 5110]KIH94030.1 hypothetical protein SPBR_05949 [Sporothrix brasiliensis 5110]